MPRRIAAKGYTRVVLVLNMKQFIQDDDGRRYFEHLRGTQEFARTLQKTWPRSLHPDSSFVPLPGAGMTSEEVGFATGVFRSIMLKELATPAYQLEKDKVRFPADLENNFQFKTLFKRAWDRWSICVRPTMTGFFTISLTYAYQQAPRTLIDLAKDAIKLQESLDVPSAVEWLKYNRARYEKEPDMLTKKERSVKELLRWLGADVDNPQASETLYYPVQWKLAVEVVNKLVSRADFLIPYADREIRLEPSPPTLSLPLHDSYIIYHFDELLAEPTVINRSRRGKTRPGVMVSASLNDIRKSNHLRNALVSLMEGTVLQDPDKSADEADGNDYFPAPRWSRADAFMGENQASWNDELCLLTPRAALILPSRRWRDHEMAVSTVPSATLKPSYGRYWEAVERMVEFVLEVCVLAQLIESDSYNLLTQIADTVEKIRSDMFKGDIVITGALQSQLTRAAHLGRMAALAQSLSHAQFWSRAEYAVQKAERLFDLLDVPRIFAHIERNIDSINSVADHVDELYLADLSEKSNARATLLSIGFAAVSLILVLLALPSFWADWMQVHNSWQSDVLYFSVLIVGTLLGLGLIGVALVFLVVVWRQRKEITGVLAQLFNHT